MTYTSISCLISWSLILVAYKSSCSYSPSAVQTRFSCILNLKAACLNFLWCPCQIHPFVGNIPSCECLYNSLAELRSASSLYPRDHPMGDRCRRFHKACLVSCAEYFCMCKSKSFVNMWDLAVNHCWFVMLL